MRYNNHYSREVESCITPKITSVLLVDNFSLYYYYHLLFCSLRCVVVEQMNERNKNKTDLAPGVVSLRIENVQT